MIKTKNQWFEPSDVLHPEVFVFVPFFGGKIENLSAHIRLINTLGYRCFAFNLSHRPHIIIGSLPISKEKHIGLKHLWADEIEEVLNFIPENKIIFSMSNPTSSAIEAITRTPRTDIKALICDGGPFDQLWPCTKNLLEHQFKVKNKLKRFWMSLVLKILWSPQHHKTLHASIKKLPKVFPILSIRSGQDLLVPEIAIDKAFEGHLQIAITKHCFQNSHHLKGLLDRPKDYRQLVTHFLNQISKAPLNP